MNKLAATGVLALALLLLALGPALSQASTITYYHNDLLGSPMVATDSSGKVIWRESYRPYGERLVNDAAGASNDLWYAGRRQDASTGLVYMGARYYDPVTGRFVSKDPVAFDEKNIQSFNRYAYANDNPYRFIDPTGRDGVDTLWMADDSVFVVTGRDFAALAAYAAGLSNGDQDLIDTSLEAMREESQANRNTAVFLLSLGRAPAEAGEGTPEGAAARGGRSAIEAALDATGKVHGSLPEAKDLVRYDVDELVRLRDELKRSVQRRIEVTEQKGSDPGHGERLAAEQQLIKSIDTHLKDR